MLRAIALTLTLFSVYLMTASGAFHSIDEEAVFVVARNIVLAGEPNQNSLYRAAPYIDQAKVGRDGAFYSKYGIGHALIFTPVLWLARLVPGATLGSSAMVVNGLATALTGGLLVLSALRLGFSERSGVALGLLYGLASFAWVYAKTMFSEPLVAFLWLAACYPLLQTVSRRRAFLSGLFLALAISMRPASVLVTPIFAILLIRPGREDTAGRLLAWAAPLVAVGVGLLAFNAYRFGDAFDFGYSEGFDGNLFMGLSGFLFSADRSVFLFAPPLLFLFAGLPEFVKRNRRVGITLAAVALATLLMYSAWAVFWGGPVWGPRYLLPVLPLLFVLLVPAVEMAVRDGAPWSHRSVLAVVALAGTAMQAPGVFWNSLPMTQTLGQRYPLWTLMPQGEWVDLAWSRAPEGLVISILLVAVAAAGLWRPRIAWVGAAVVATTVGTLLLLGYLGESGLGYPWSEPDQAAFETLAADARPGDGFILNPTPYQAPFSRLTGWLNRAQPPVPVYGVLRDPVKDVNAAELIYLLGRHKRIWLLTDGVAPGNAASVTEGWMALNAAAAGTEWIDGSSRLSVFERLISPTVRGAERVTFDDIVTLESWEIALDVESAQVTLQWWPLGADQRDLHTFVQLLDPEGQLISGWDHVPQFGFMPANRWQPGIAFREQMAIGIPRGAVAAPIRIIAGIVDAKTGERLVTSTGGEVVTLYEGALERTRSP